MPLEKIQRIVLPTEVLFARNEAVNGLVAIAAQFDCFAHLLAREPLLKPLVAVAGPWNQVMRGGARLHRAITKLARNLQFGISVLTH